MQATRFQSIPCPNWISFIVYRNDHPDFTQKYHGLRQIFREARNIKVMMFSDGFNVDCVDIVLREGIASYFLLSALDTSLIEMIRVVFSGKIVLSPEIAQSLLAWI